MRRLILSIFMLSAQLDSISAQDWNMVGNTAVDLFRKYLAIDTTNPPGNVSSAAEFLGKTLESAGVPVEMIWTDKARGKVNLLGRLSGNGSKRPLLLLNHMDIVPVDRSGWDVDPFSGVRKDGYIYGRGALDMKNIGSAQLMTMILLKQNDVKLERDVLFLSVADEEGGGMGTAWINANRRNDIDPEYVLDEGGFGSEGFFTKDNRLIFCVGVAEKRNFTVRLSVSGTPGHASMPPEDNANFIMARALGKIAEYKPPEFITPVAAEMIKRLGKLDNTLFTNATLHNTISLTIMKGYAGEQGKSNVIPASAEATLDCRLLPGQDPTEFVKQLQNVIGDQRIQIRPERGEIINDVSSFDTDLFKIIEKETKLAHPESVTLPHLVVYATDSRHFRRRGAIGYGFFPGPVTLEEYRSIHGHNERIREDSFREAVRIYYNVVREFCRVK